MGRNYTIDILKEEEKDALGRYLLLFLATVAHIDGKLDFDEYMAIDSIFELEKIVNPLTKEILNYIHNNSRKLKTERLHILNSKNVLKDFSQLDKTAFKAIESLKSVYGKEIINEFLAEFILFAEKIGEASGGKKGLLGFGKESGFSKEEIFLISNFMAKFKVENNLLEKLRRKKEEI